MHGPSCAAIVMGSWWKSRGHPPSRLHLKYDTMFARLFDSSKNFSALFYFSCLSHSKCALQIFFMIALPLTNSLSHFSFHAFYIIQNVTLSEMEAYYHAYQLFSAILEDQMLCFRLKPGIHMIYTHVCMNICAYVCRICV